MAGNQPARIPPVRNSWALVTTAGGDGAVPAPAPGAAAEEKEAEGPAEAPAGTAGPAATGAFVARVAASPGVNVDAEVRIKMEDGKFVEGVITGRRSVDGSYPVAPLGLSGERGPVLNLMHGRHFFTVAEYERDYASQQGQLSGSAPRMPQIAARDAPTARAPARYTIETVPPGFGFIEGSLVRKVFGGAAARVDKCWPPFLLLAQGAAGEYLDQDVLTLVAAVEQALEGAAGEGVVLAPPVFDVFDDAESVLRAHVLRLGAALKEAATRKAKKQRIEDPSSRQPGALGLRVMEELLGGSLAPKAKTLCAGLRSGGAGDRTRVCGGQVLFRAAAQGAWVHRGLCTYGRHHTCGKKGGGNRVASRVETGENRGPGGVSLPGAHACIVPVGRKARARAARTVFPHHVWQVGPRFLTGRGQGRFDPRDTGTRLFLGGRVTCSPRERHDGAAAATSGRSFLGVGRLPLLGPGRGLRGRGVSAKGPGVLLARSISGFRS